jgi:hypothetical protein
LIQHLFQKGMQGGINLESINFDTSKIQIPGGTSIQKCHGERADSRSGIEQPADSLVSWEK